eukprot:Plantae.Rhodophyta-Purpureofilum_apyrenoidigerum.ctg15054.p1 GENE.Plantae.Rhodophyta-Purpureofilum_apyrenoidigerum.ctg15054~~Plantae.Rhodophyta-Purpureofilum_apyrenoidigerum.ctg15054.p1  ORF type:complete len:277 (-),score=28.65 Plantae.Rhodophyta-Purpureofilum_apyrenoidigerum.ctg15054:129-959(-)
MDTDLEARAPPSDRSKIAVFFDGTLSAGTFSTLAALIFWLIARFEVQGREPRVIPFYVADATHWGSLTDKDSVRLLEVLLVLVGFIIVILPFELIIGRLGEGKPILRWFQFGLGLFTAGLISDGFVGIGKVLVGELRPDFYERCFGQGTAPPSADEFSKIIASDADCPIKDTSILLDGRSSFPSGHASLAFSGCFFMVLYLINYAKRLRKPLIAQIFFIVAFVPLGYAFHVAISRVRDFRHFPADVIGGGLVGLISSSVVFLWTLILSEVGKGPQY